MTATPRRRWIPLLIVFVVLGVIAQGCFWTKTRPPIPTVVVPTLPTPERDGQKQIVGGSSLERREGYWFMVHRGDSVTMGAEHARLGGFLTQRAEDVLRADFNRRLPAPLKLILPAVMMWRFRHLAAAIPTPLLEELYGFGATYPDRTPFPLDAYQRGIYYHALHDMVQDLVGNPFVDPGVAGACTGFGASGRGTTDGHTIVGRNFDFEVVPIFDSEKVVHLYARDGVIPVLSVSWMGMSGVLTGMNADGIWIALNAARSEGRNRKGPPVALLVRQVLEEARSVADVERLLAATAPIVTDIYVVADGKTGEVVAIERGQTRMDRRGLDGRGRLTVANHLLTETFAGDEDDAGMRRFSTTMARHLRMQELVDAEPLSAERGFHILRDRRGLGGRELAPGNRNAIDAYISTHSVVADATDRVLWVATAPHTSGPARAIDLLDELARAGIDPGPWRSTLPPGARAWERSRPLPPALAPSVNQSLEELEAEWLASRAPPPVREPTPEPHLGAHDGAGRPQDLPPGELVATGEFVRVERYLALLADAEAFLEHDAPGFALSTALEAQALYPQSAEAKRVEGEAHAALDEEPRARAALEEYLRRYPAFGPEYVRVTKWLHKHGGLPTIERPDL